MRAPRAASASAEYVVAERLQTLLCRKPKRRHAEKATDGAQQRIVVVGRLRNRPALDERRDQHGTDSAAARPLHPGRSLGPRQSLFVAAGLRCIRLLQIGFIESHDQKSVFLECRRTHDDRDPLLQERIGRDETPGFAVNARGVMPIIAKVRRDEVVVCRCSDVLEICREKIEIYNARIAARLLVDDGVEIDEWIVLDRVLVLIGRA